MPKHEGPPKPPDEDQADPESAAFRKWLDGFSATFKSVLEDMSDPEQRLSPTHLGFLGSISRNLAQLADQQAHNDADYQLCKTQSVFIMHSIMTMLRALEQGHYSMVASLEKDDRYVDLAASRFQLDDPSQLRQLAQLFHERSGGAMPLIVYNASQPNSFEQPAAQLLAVTGISKSKAGRWAVTYVNMMDARPSATGKEVSDQLETVEIVFSSGRPTARLEQFPEAVHYRECYVFLPPSPPGGQEDIPIAA